MNRWLKVWIAVMLAICLMGGGIIFAQTYLRSITLDFVIVEPTTPPPLPPPTGGLLAYMDASCTQPLLQPIHFGEITKGSAASMTLYLKNTTSGNLTVSITSQSGIGWLAQVTPATMNLTSGEVKTCILGVTVNTSAVSGNVSTVLPVGW